MADLTVQSGPFKGKPQLWFTRAEVERLLAAEREACAKLIESMRDKWVDGSDQFGRPCPARVRVTPRDCAAAIRALGAPDHRPVTAAEDRWLRRALIASSKLIAPGKPASADQQESGR